MNVKSDAVGFAAILFFTEVVPLSFGSVAKSSKTLSSMFDVFMAGVSNGVRLHGPRGDRAACPFQLHLCKPLLASVTSWNCRMLGRWDVFTL